MNEFHESSTDEFFSRVEHAQMIENVDCTLKILEFFARDDVDNPSNLTVDNLMEEFPDLERNVISYHIRCAAECDLLDVDIKVVKAFEGSAYVIGTISGLTAKGGDYVKDSRSKLWDQGKQQLETAGLAITTAILVDLFPVWARKALGL